MPWMPTAQLGVETAAPVYISCHCQLSRGATKKTKRHNTTRCNTVQHTGGEAAKNGTTTPPTNKVAEVVQINVSVNSNTSARVLAPTSQQHRLDGNNAILDDKHRLSPSTSTTPPTPTRTTPNTIYNTTDTINTRKKNENSALYPQHQHSCH